MWNATNVSREVRSRAIDHLAGYQARIRILYLEASEPELTSRNAHRDHPVPQRVRARLLTRWVVPDLTEAHEVSRQ